MTQRDFLIGLGIDVRLIKLLRNVSPEVASQLAAGYQRLLDPDGMGQQYKCLALFNTSLGLPAPWLS